MTNEGGRQAAHILLDTITAWDPDQPDEWGDRANRALLRLSEVDAFRATYDDETDSVVLDLSNLLGATAVLLQHLIHEIAARKGVDPERVVFDLREFVDRTS